MTLELQTKILVSLGNQIVDWTDDTAATWITADELNIDKQLVIEFVQNNLGEIFRDFDGSDTPLFSFEGWEYYQRMKEIH